MAKKSRPAKMGRPRLEEAGQTLKATKPWVGLNMSRATWYRRRLERQISEKTRK